MMDAVATLAGAIPIAVACAALGLSRATVYRRRKPRPAATAASVALARRSSPRRLSDEERQRVLDVLHSPEFADQPPAEVYARLLSRGEYVASVRSMYRVLAAQGEVRERRRGHVSHTHEKPSLEATRPNQVWTWDITKVPSLERGVFYYVYVILDLFSRFVVGWLAADRENARLATHLVAETVERHGIERGQLKLHSDRGAPMTAGSMTQLLASLQIDRSLSRPHVSDDNPFVESHFKTTKYQPDYPVRFGSLLHVRAWFTEFFDWYCNDHHHAGLALFTPADVFHGRVDDIATRRQAALDAAYAAHPERFVNGPPRVPRPPTSVSINPPPPDEEKILDAARKVPLPGVPATRQETNAGSRVADGGRVGGGRGVGEAQPLPLTPRAAPGTPALSTAVRFAARGPRQ